jgi:hypothetical protein
MECAGLRPSALTCALAPVLLVLLKIYWTKVLSLKSGLLFVAKVAQLF